MTDISNAYTAAGKPGRRLGSKNARPQVPGWHDLAEEAKIQGCDERTVIRRGNQGRGPKPVKFAGHPLFEDGASERFLAELKRRQEQAAEPPRRGRPRKVTEISSGQRGSAPLTAE
jgi:hypothetical protein